jgi:hypothetical protein
MPGGERCNTELIDVEPRFTGLTAVQSILRTPGINAGPNTAIAGNPDGWTQATTRGIRGIMELKFALTKFRNQP